MVVGEYPLINVVAERPVTEKTAVPLTASSPMFIVPVNPVSSTRISISFNLKIT